MPITFEKNVFHLYNDNMSYCIKLSPHGDLLHLYWGARADAKDIDCVTQFRTGFSCPEEEDFNYSLDALPQEYPTYATPDLRTPALEAIFADGSSSLRLTYRSHTIEAGKPPIAGLPMVYTENDNEAQTLKIVTSDDISGLEVTLIYTIFEHQNVLCRHAEIKNTGRLPLLLTKAASLSMDLYDDNLQYLHLCGTWSREKHIEYCPIHNGVQSIESRRGASSHAENPFLAILSGGADEHHGSVYGLSLVYSGNFLMNMEKEQYGTVRVQAGIHPHGFRWKLDANERFITPEVAMVYSENGLTQMSQTFHTLYRSRLCRGKYRDAVRPVLINSWESAYFDFNEEKLVNLAQRASELGMELFVLDDGWFHDRNDEPDQIGDWIVDEKKFPNGIDAFIEKLNRLGLQFGIWFEPEVFSPKSELYQKHPDWALHVPNRTAHRGRWQYLLDLSRADVCEHLIDTLSAFLSTHRIDYVKWDMNRNFSEVFSSALPADRQGEVAHRYMLGLYRILETLTTRFPDILFEGCSGGGGRNDPGMLYYMPQNWASDDTDAVERMYIQYGASMVYPASTIGAHVSAVPNHQVGRVTPLSLRGTVAMSGTFGYELNLTKLSEEECNIIREQVTQYKRIRETILFGTQYRLLDPFTTRSAGWIFVSENKEKAVAFYMNKLAVPNAPYRRMRLAGLDADAQYRIGEQTYSGRSLMNFGLWLPANERDFESCIWEIEKV